MKAKPVIGLAVGRGTGAELAAVFEQVLGGLARLYATEIDIARSPRTYHSYVSLKSVGLSDELTAGAGGLSESVSGEAGGVSGGAGDGSAETEAETETEADDVSDGPGGRTGGESGGAGGGIDGPGGGIERIRRLTQEDAEHYEAFCREQAALGTPAVFRTAINAQSLYLVRQRLQAVKVDVIGTGDPSLLLVRDQAQGFYTGENEHRPGVVSRTMTFSREITEKVVAFALRRARQEWPDSEPGEVQVVMAYKFHLLDGALDAWVAEISARHGVEVRLFQPDTVNRNLIEHGPAARTVVIAGNEWADIMHVVLLDRFGSERQENRYTENVHLHPEAAGLVEYQTVHGSADDLAGRNTVNPVATVRAAAAIAERHAGCAGAVHAVEAALDSLRQRGVGTPDTGGRHSTTDVVDALLDALRPDEHDAVPHPDDAAPSAGATLVAGP